MAAAVAVVAAVAVGGGMKFLDAANIGSRSRQLWRGSSMEKNVCFNILVFGLH